DSAEKYAEGRAVRIEVRTKKDLDNTKKLAAIKMTNWIVALDRVRRSLDSTDTPPPNKCLQRALQHRSRFFCVRFHGGC
ncbi:MAG TPA: hypothetical protein VLC48_04400, partial [Gemmatimonadota bacterium]|nr:hypothetical protein [Gemmatimonadota bacterium]